MHHGLSSSGGGVNNPHQRIQRRASMPPMDTAAEAYMDHVVRRTKLRKAATFDERLKEKIDSEGVRAGQKTTFEERLMTKMKSGRKGDGHAYEQRSERKLESRGDAQTAAEAYLETPIRKNEVESLKKTGQAKLEERLQKKIQSGGKGDDRAFEGRGPTEDDSQDECSTGSQTINTSFHKSILAPPEIECNSLDDSLCSEGNQAIDMEAQVQVQPISHPVVPNIDIDIDDVLSDLQRFKEDNGDVIPTSHPIHPIVSRLIRRLSSQEAEPFVQRCDQSDTGSEMQEIQQYSLGSRVSLFFDRISIHSRSSRGSHFFHDSLIRATLVDEEEAEVAVAVPVGVFAHRWKQLGLAMCILLALLAVLLSLTLTNVINVRGEDMMESLGSQPTSFPTFDPSPTLEIIQSRGHIRCGMGMNTGEGFNLDLCRAVAAVVVGSPEKYERVPVTTKNRWQQLNDRNVDLLNFGETHTIEREVRESSTGRGFAFSSPYIYDGGAYFGNQTFVHCAEEQTRYDECSSLKICVVATSTHHVFQKALFPSDYLIVVPSRDEVVRSLFNGICNVAADDKSRLMAIAIDFSNGTNHRGYVVGQKLMTKEPLAFVTRDTDRQFSDIVNWVIQAVIYGEEQGLTKNLSLCRNYSNLTLYDVTDLLFLNSVYCVGNYGEIFGEHSNNRVMNQINNGSTGMLYATPFGNIDKDDTISPASDSTLVKIRNEGFIKCGVVVPDSFEGNVTGSIKLVGMSVNYCQTLAAALFTGDSKDINILTFPETDKSSFVALNNGTIDVLVGARVQRKYDFGSQSLEGFHFSTPYYYGNEAASDDVSFYSIATRDHKDDLLFSSFVNSIVTATIYAQEIGIQREESNKMPSVSLFGNDLNWALRDAIAYSGSYDEIYMKNFGSGVLEVDRGRNILNKGGPIMHSFPHLSLDGNKP